MKSGFYKIIFCFIMFCSCRTSEDGIIHIDSPKGYDDYRPLTPLFSIEEAIALKNHKPLLVVFTGINSISIKGADWEVLKKENIKALIEEKFNLVCLLIDDPKYIKKGTDSIQVGDYNLNLELKLMDLNISPVYVVLDENYNVINSHTEYPFQENKVLDFLLESLKRSGVK